MIDGLPLIIVEAKLLPEGDYYTSSIHLQVQPTGPC